MQQTRSIVDIFSFSIEYGNSRARKRVAIVRKFLGKFPGTTRTYVGCLIVYW